MYVPDLVLRAALARAQHPSPHGAPPDPTPDQLRSVVELEWPPADVSGESAKIGSLEGLEHATELRWLQIPANGVDSVEPLRTCLRLRDLDLVGSPLGDGLGPLADHPALERIWLGNAELPDLSPLESMRGLREVYLIGVSGVDDGGVAVLARLRRAGVTVRAQREVAEQLAAADPTLRSRAARALDDAGASGLAAMCVLGGPNATDDRGTPLLLHVLQGRMERAARTPVIDALLDEGADSRGLLAFAANPWTCEDSVFDRLLDAGDLDAPEYHPPLARLIPLTTDGVEGAEQRFAWVRARGARLAVPAVMCAAVERGRLDLLEIALAEGGDPNAESGCGSAMSFAVRCDRVDALALLLRAGGDPQRVIGHVRSVEALALLEAHGAELLDPNSALVALDNPNPYTDPAAAGMIRLLDLLLARGADPAATDGKGSNLVGRLVQEDTRGPLIDAALARGVPVRGPEIGNVLFSARPEYHDRLIAAGARRYEVRIEPNPGALVASGPVGAFLAEVVAADPSTGDVGQLWLECGTGIGRYGETALSTLLRGRGLEPWRDRAFEVFQAAGAWPTADERADEVTLRAACHSAPELFERVFTSRTWSAGARLRRLGCSSASQACDDEWIDRLCDGVPLGTYEAVVALCRIGRLDRVERALAAGAPLEAPDRRSCSPLRIATARDAVPIMRRLLALGADPDGGPFNLHPPVLAVSSAAAFELLREAGADLSCRRKLDQDTNPLAWARNRFDSEARPALLAAISDAGVVRTPTRSHLIR